MHGELDFRARIVGRGGVFTPLQDVEFFRQVSVDSEAGTLVWPNGVDFCPDVLYDEVTGRPVQDAEELAVVLTTRPEHDVRIVGVVMKPNASVRHEAWVSLTHLRARFRGLTRDKRGSPEC